MNPKAKTSKRGRNRVKRISVRPCYSFRVLGRRGKSLALLRATKQAPSALAIALIPTMRSTSLFVAALAAAAAVANCDASTCQPTLALRGGGGLVEKVGGFVGGFLRTASFGDMSSPHLVAPEAQVSSGTLHLRGGEDAKARTRYMHSLPRPRCRVWGGGTLHS